MFLIALTGGIGAGKSTIAQRLGQLGADIVDADVMARRAVAAGSPALKRIVERFGSGVLLENGELNRAALGSIVFADPQSRIDLEAIVHPAVHALTTAAFADITAKKSDAIIVYDVPLLLEATNRYDFDTVLVAHAPSEIRIERLVKIRGMTLEEAESRVAAQASDSERLAIADTVIDTSGTLEHTIQQVDDFWNSLHSTDA